MAAGTLLIVDDDPLQREYLAALLDEGGYSSEQARDGREALEMLGAAADRYDAVLLDRHMPHLDGIDTLRRLKGEPRMAALPVIFQTVDFDGAQMLQAMDQGAYYYLAKPVKPELLLATVYSAVQSRRRHQALGHQVRASARTLALMDLGRFRFRNLDEAEGLTHLLAAACPDPDRVAVGLSELFINAIEHGNLEMGYQDTTEAIERRGRFEEIHRRQQDPRLGARFVEVRFEHLPDRYRILVKDQGKGFDWHEYLRLSPERAYDSHGRGVFMAAQCFDRLEYLGKGNAVSAEIRLPDDWS